MKKSFYIITLFLIIISIGFCISGFTTSNAKTQKKTHSDSQGIVILELFTSQGCSSCPPADRVLEKYVLTNNPNIIPIAFHIDYWNYIGWKDPFSRAEFTNRQRDYSRNFNSGTIYTPQLIINGKYQVVGSNENSIKTLVNQELLIKNPARIDIYAITLVGNKLVVKCSTTDLSANKTVNVALVKKKEFTSIKRGENTGLKQTSYNIVYDFKSKSLTNGTENQTIFDFKSDWKASDFMIVVYLQNNSNGKIIAASKKEIN
ncbi:hypothetical protein H4V97_003079 [Flavobacterium sp. CG_23.5]|uniref:DUF1223 domain-containing protein n=1 Tax=unclassified Flavobacterium TaxID=196869 RepID=UPI0018CA6EB3|nr:MULTISPECIES: DUF1223 domain-containing protein [unclassified Flavobacterium]MBG6109727.1 hypothetical protein [Flavobacterium sp. CG_9.10]MBP2284761.1 hypothetical protein [Flavobacterium sp. CG_23.5]